MEGCQSQSEKEDSGGLMCEGIGLQLLFCDLENLKVSFAIGSYSMSLGER